MKKSLFVKTAVALALAAPLLASAESQFVAGTATSAPGAVARLNFQVVIPKVLYLAVGNGSAGFIPSNTIDELTFSYNATPADVGNTTDTVAQSVNVRVLGNNGNVSIAATGSGSGLVSDLDSADIIPWSEILATSSDATNFNVPAVGAPSTTPTPVGKITNRTTAWNYAYSNSNVVAPGTYTGQITYTATMP